MRRLVRENALCALAATTASAAIAWIGLYGFAWNDYEVEVEPAVDALTRGHVLEFLRLAPSYGGSLIERAPFALLPGLWGGGELAVYRMLALPCLLAAVALAVWLCAQMRGTADRPGRSRLARTIVVGVCVANPLTLQALELGHPEELLGACLCVAAVLLAARGRAVWAGALLGLAIANKEWAVLAVGPALLALPVDARARPVGARTRPLDMLAPPVDTRARPVGALVIRLGTLARRWRAPLRCLLSAAAVSAIVLAPLLAASARFSATASAAAVPAGGIFQPWQLWWFLGWHGPLVHGLFGSPKPGYRTGPAWTSAISHPLIVAAGVALAGAVWLARRRRARHDAGGFAPRGPIGQPGREREALLTLALVMLVRCVLDTWDTAYYMLPFVIALVAWEARGDGPRLPLLALSCTALAWLSFEGLPDHGASPDVQAALFLAWTLPLCAWLARTLYAPGRSARRRSSRGTAARPRAGGQPPAAFAGRERAPGAAQETTVSSFGSPLST